MGGGNESKLSVMSCEGGTLSGELARVPIVEVVVATVAFETD